MIILTENGTSEVNEYSPVALTVYFLTQLKPQVKTSIEFLQLAYTPNLGLDAAKRLAFGGLAFFDFFKHHSATDTEREEATGHLTKFIHHFMDH